MWDREREPLLVDWVNVYWQEEPYKGVFLSILDEPLNPLNPRVPLYTQMALKVLPGAEIPLHRHIRKDGWTEELTFPNGGHFWILRTNYAQKVLENERLMRTIAAGEAFGLRNDRVGTLYFTSLMRPGFTGYGEIEELSFDDRLAS